MGLRGEGDGEDFKSGLYQTFDGWRCIFLKSYFV